MKRYEIVLVNYPFSDGAQSKHRPAVVLSTPSMQTVILCQITTKARGHTYEIPLFRDDCLGDIRFDSYINIDNLFTFNKALILRKIGFIANEKIRLTITRKLKQLLITSQ